jgi:hypothetical protein
MAGITNVHRCQTVRQSEGKTLNSQRRVSTASTVLKCEGEKQNKPEICPRKFLNKSSQTNAKLTLSAFDDSIKDFSEVKKRSKKKEEFLEKCDTKK